MTAEIKLIGLTGGICSGKSLVSKFLNQQKIPIISSDDIAHQILKKNSHVFRKIIACFGDKILTKSKNIDRKKLAQIIFNDPLKRKKLNSITHPIIISKIFEEIEKLRKKNYKIIALEIPLLIETGFFKMVDFVIIVYAKKTDQIQRLIARDRLTRIDAIKRINSQMSYTIKRKYADYVIDNSRDISYTKKQVKDLIIKLKNN
jgi:dephospho-CoA kinase